MKQTSEFRQKLLHWLARFKRWTRNSWSVLYFLIFFLLVIVAMLITKIYAMIKLLGLKISAPHLSYRILHRWIAIGVLLPALLTTGTGVLLILRHQLNWVSPPALTSSTPVQWASIEQVYAALLADNRTGVRRWKDAGSIIAKPGKGVFQVRTKGGMLVQLHGQSAQILDVSPRRVTFLIRLHEGSYWSKWVTYGIFLPSAIGLLVLIISGLVLLVRIYGRRLKTLLLKVAKGRVD